MAAGTLAKSTPRGIFERHGSKLYGEDKYHEQLAAFKAKKDVAAFAGHLPPKSEKAPKSFAKGKKGFRKSRKPKKASSKGECLSAQGRVL